MHADRDVPLQDHAKTVAAYLNDYKAAPDSEKGRYAGYFSSYLLTTCWRNMYNRMSSWPAVGLIFELNGALGSLSCIDGHAWEELDNMQGSGDRTLIHMLVDIESVIPTLMQRLANEYQNVLELLAAVKVAKDAQRYRFYNKSTARQFHCLLVADLIAFASSLRFVKAWKYTHVSTVPRS